MKKLIVDKKFDNKKLHDFLLYSFPSLSSNAIYKALRKKDIRINGKRVSENKTIFSQDEICIYIPDNILFNTNLDIIFEDSNIIILNKPFNLEITGNNSLTSLVQNNYSSEKEFPLPCHRLDRNTTGLIIFAKNEVALSILLEKFKNKEIEKHYACIVYGIPQKSSATLNDFLFKDSKKGMVYISPNTKPGYLPITTKYHVLKSNYKKNISILDVELVTGRTHQIRAHLAFINHPIIGDGKYGTNEINKKFKVKHQLLCSYKITFRFRGDSGILEYLSGKSFEIPYDNFYNIIEEHN